MDYQIVPFTLEHSSAVIRFTDKHIGDRYFLVEDLEKICKFSAINGESCSFLCFYGDQLVGIRFCYAPGTGWDVLFRQNDLTLNKIDLPFSQIGYFKSLFIHTDHQGEGLGQTLSQKSLAVMERMGAKAVLAHCWKESPGNSSVKYFERMGFKPINDHKKFWADIDYDCTRCKKPPCQCTALEMIYYISE